MDLETPMPPGLMIDAVETWVEEHDDYDETELLVISTLHYQYKIASILHHAFVDND